MLSFKNYRFSGRKLAVVFCSILFTINSITFANECSIRSDSTNSFNEVFPLIQNLQYIYNYKYEEQFIDMIVPISGRIDSGFVEYTILDSSLSSDTTAVWSVKQVSIMWHKVWQLNGDTTCELTIDTIIFPLHEMNYGNHQLWMSGIVWDFPIYDPVQPIYRYANSPSVLIIRNWSELYNHGSDTLKMSITEGFFYRSLSARIGSIQNGTSYYLKINLLHPPVVDVKVNTSGKQSFSLNQNYPNPFNPSTIISYQLPIAGNVTLKVYDILGREVATLVDEYRNAGSYDVQFIMNNLQLSSGIYFYNLKAGDYTDTKKMIMIK